MSFNKVILQGNLTHNIEVRSTARGTSVGQFAVAVNRRWRDDGGQEKEEVTFVECEVWGKTCEVMARHLGKGSAVLLEGRLKLDQWTDRETAKPRQRLKVVVEGFSFVSGRPRTMAAQDEPPASAATPERMEAEDTPF